MKVRILPPQPNATNFVDLTGDDEGYFKSETWSLGLMKFSDKLLVRHFNLGGGTGTEPDASAMLAQVMGEGRGPEGTATPPDRRWMMVDLALYGHRNGDGPAKPTLNSHLLGIPALDALRADGAIEPHLHGPPARHLAP